jgi:hypothetical protein
LIIAIVHQFLREAKARGQHPVVLVFPGPDDFPFFRQHQRLVYEPLLQNFDKHGVDYVDLGGEILSRLGNRNYQEIFLAGRYPHFNEEGNRLVAHIVYDYLSSGKGAVISSAFIGAGSRDGRWEADK